MRIIINVSAIVVHEPCQDRKVAALSEFAMCADFFYLFSIKSINFLLAKEVFSDY